MLGATTSACCSAVALGRLPSRCARAGSSAAVCVRMPCCSKGPSSVAGGRRLGYASLTAPTWSASAAAGVLAGRVRFLTGKGGRPSTSASAEMLLPARSCAPEEGFLGGWEAAAEGPGALSAARGFPAGCSSLIGAAGAEAAPAWCLIASDAAARCCTPRPPKPETSWMPCAVYSRPSCVRCKRCGLAHKAAACHSPCRPRPRSCFPGRHCDTSQRWVPADCLP